MYQVLSQTTSSRLSVSEKFTGLSLLSPANMSLATKKYMKKYGLVTLEEESDDNDDKENGKRMILFLNEIEMVTVFCFSASY